MTERGNGAAVLRVVAAFISGVATTLLSVGVLARPAVERVADERAAVVEHRLTEKLVLIEQSRQREYEALKAEIVQLRQELIQLIKSRQ